MTAGIKQTQISWPQPPHLKKSDADTAPAVLTAVAAPIHYYRDGDVVLYKRPDSGVWQCRYQLLNGAWQRFSTKQRNLVDAARRGCELYDEARFRERNGLAPIARRFRDAAEATLVELRTELAAGTGKRIYADYCSAIERYLLPFFGNRYFDRIDHRAVTEFEQWRNQQIGHEPAHSTLLTYAAAWNRIQQTALERGWITAATAIPKLPVRGRRTQARPGFTADEVVQLRSYMQSWSAAKTRKPIEAEMRLLLRDYVELLLMTGMRHGTEAMRVEWQHWDWYADKSGNKFLRLRVSGKTGARWLIAKHEAIGQMQLSASASTPHEIEHVMDRSLFDRYVAATTRRKFVELYRRHVRLLNIAPQEESGLVVHCRDARDNKFLALALACSADLIISSDTDFLSMNPYHGIPILKPAEFLNAYE